MSSEVPTKEQNEFLTSKNEFLTPKDSDETQVQAMLKAVPENSAKDRFTNNCVG